MTLHCLLWQILRRPNTLHWRRHRVLEQHRGFQVHAVGRWDSLHRLYSTSTNLCRAGVLFSRSCCNWWWYSLGNPSRFTSSSLVFLLCSLFPYSFLFTSSILNFLSHVSFEDLLQNSRGSTLFGSESSPSVSIASLCRHVTGRPCIDLIRYRIHSLSLKIFSLLAEWRQWKNNFLLSKEWVPQLKIINYLHIASNKGSKIRPNSLSLSFHPKTKKSKPYQYPVNEIRWMCASRWFKIIML